MQINLTAPINTLSYGYASLNILKELSKSHQVSLFPIPHKGAIEVTTQEDLKVVQQALNNSQFYNKNAPSIRLWHQFDLAQHAGTPRIGFPIFELDKFNKLEFHHLSSQDKIFVCSEWAKKVIRENLAENIPTAVVPLGVDSSVFSYNKREKNRNMVVLNVGKIEVRKGVDFILDAFNAAFVEKDKVELWMAWANPFLSPEETASWEKLYLESNMGRAGKIKFLPRFSTQQELVGVMQAADVGFFPSRAEGWNLPALEMLACGKHIIATDYSAHTEFLSSENARLISIDSLEPAYDGRWFFGQGNWAKLGESQLEQAVSHLRHLYSCFSSSSELINMKGLETASHFSWANSASSLVSHL